MTTTDRATILDRLAVLADPTRSRLLLVLDGQELAVSELCAVLQLPQSTVSRHLKVLNDDGWVVARSEGTTRRYAVAPDLDPAARRLWHLVRGQVAEDVTAAQDAERLRSVLARRRTRSQEFFAGAAGQWDGLRAELFGRRADLLGLLGLLDDDWVVGDLGCGTGQVAASLAPFVGRVIAVDQSRAMLTAARARLGDVPNVELRHGELEGLPIEASSLDAAVLFLVLDYVPEPARVLAEAARALQPGGRLLVVDMTPHGREEYRRTMGHLWQGFSAGQVGEWLTGAGLERVRYRTLPPDPAAKGPALFAATARRGISTGTDRRRRGRRLAAAP
jgi:SAM-dependent methyltransferase